MIKASEVTVCRLKGYAYPSVDKEDEMFNSHFANPQTVALKTILLIPHTYNRCSVLFSSEAKFSPYYVSEMTVEVKAPRQTTDNMYLRNTFVACQSHTSMRISRDVSFISGDILSSMSNPHTVHNFRTDDVLQPNLLLPCGSILADCPARVSESRTTGSSGSSIFSRSTGSSSSIVTTTMSRYLQRSYHDDLAEKIQNVLAPTFTPSFPLQSFSASACCPSLTLVEYQHDMQLRDVRESLQLCANRVGVPLLTADTRLFSHGQTRAQSAPLHPLGPSVHSHSGAEFGVRGTAYAPLSDLSADRLLSLGPCILHLEGIDLLRADSSAAQTNGGGGMTAEQQQSASSEAVFVRALRAWIDSLQQAICERHAHCSGSPADSAGCVAIVASTSHSAGLSSALQGLFTSVVRASDHSALTLRQIETVLRNHTGGGDTTFGVGSSGSASDAPHGSVTDSCGPVAQHIVSCGGSYSAAQAVAQETQLGAFADQNLEAWLRQCGLDRQLSVSGTGAQPPILADIVSSVPCISRNGITGDGGGSDGNSGSSGGQNKYATSIAPVLWGDIGGLDRVRREILDVLELPFLHPHLFPPGCPRRQGVLLYGPPGTGKTLVAKAVATECKMAFISVKGPELLDSYVGESERNVRELFACARDLAPCVLFFDEVDSLAPARARGNDSGGGVMDRIVSQLLTEIDQLALNVSGPGGGGDASNEVASVSDSGVEESKDLEEAVAQLEACGDGEAARRLREFSEDRLDALQQRLKRNKAAANAVFIIAATNRPDLLDPALLRPGRFDRKVYLGVCRDLDARVQILAAQTRKFTLSANTDLTAVAAALPDNVTGADIGAVTASAFGTAMQRKLAELTAEALSSSSSSSNDGAVSGDSEWDESQCLAIKTHINRAEEGDLVVAVTQADLLEAAGRAVPSVVDLKYYESLGQRYDDSAHQQ